MFEITRAADDAFDRVVRHREAQLLRIAYRILGNRADAEEFSRRSRAAVLGKVSGIEGRDAIFAVIALKVLD